MNGREQGFLLLTSHLGDPERKVLTVAQFRTLAQRLHHAEKNTEDRQLMYSDLVALGYDVPTAQRMARLLSEEERLAYYVSKASQFGCVPITRVSHGYPLILHKRLGLNSPGVLWARGDLSLLEEPCVSLVGSRDIREECGAFAAEAGREAARQGYVLVSGNARGADRTAQESCLEAGGKVISVVADQLRSHPVRKNMLYLSEDGFDDGFTAQRALSRNRVIHAMGLKTFVAQTSCNMGGTWDGTVKNLRNGWSPVYCYDDGSKGAYLLGQMGAILIDREDLSSFYDLPVEQLNFFDR